jgi:hypothetical protein
MKLKHFLASNGLVLAAAVAIIADGLSAQTNVLTVTTPPRSTAKRNGAMTARITVHVQEGYHVNSIKPTEDYMIPFKLTWDKGVFEFVDAQYPEPKMQKYAFAPKPIAVYSGTFDIVSKFKVPANAPQGISGLSGKLRYQACNDVMCLPPKTVDIKLPVETF